MSQISRDQLKQLQKRYHTDAAIGNRLGVSRQMIFKLRKQYDIPAAEEIHSKRNREIIHLYETGIELIKLAVRFDLSLTQIYRIVNLKKKDSKMRETKPTVYRSAEELAETLKKFREKGQTIVSTNGCFDLLHAGHLQYLHEAADLGDILIIGINSDASVKRLKGESRPLQSELDRATIMASLKPVDYTLIFEEDDPCAFLEILRPDIHVKGGDYLPENLPEKAVVESHGGKIAILSFKDGISTTKILEKMQNS